MSPADSQCDILSTNIEIPKCVSRECPVVQDGCTDTATQDCHLWVLKCLDEQYNTEVPNGWGDGAAVPTINRATSLVCLPLTHLTTGVHNY